MNKFITNRQFAREYIEHNGFKSIWLYNLDINPNGPILVENFYPSNYEDPNEKLERVNRNLPITKQTFLNPANSKMVGYGRAKTLGLIS